MVRSTSHPARDSLCLMAYLRCANARILLAYCLYILLSQVVERHYLVHEIAVRLPSHESVVLFAPALVHGIPAWTQA